MKKYSEEIIEERESWLDGGSGPPDGADDFRCPCHHLVVAERRGVGAAQHGLQHGTPCRPAALIVLRRHVRRYLVPLAPAQQDPGVMVVAGVAVELGASVGAEER